eukprot:6211245-Pleurochrysis_carterae.AAC.3
MRKPKLELQSYTRSRASTLCLSACGFGAIKWGGALLPTLPLGVYVNTTCPPTSFTSFMTSSVPAAATPPFCTGLYCTSHPRPPDSLLLPLASSTVSFSVAAALAAVCF